MIDTPNLDKFLKGGPGSGQKGHKTTKVDPEKRAQAKQQVKDAYDKAKSSGHPEAMARARYLRSEFEDKYGV